MRVVAVALLLLISPVALARAAAPARDLLYTAPGERGSDVYVASQDGSSRIELTGGVGLAAMPAWSPDGTQVALATNRDTGGMGMAEIYVAAADGGSLRRLTFDATGKLNAKLSPAWSPDGSTIAYIENGHEVWLIPSAGGTPRRLADLGDDALSLSWSPDGARLLTVVQSSAPAIVTLDAHTGATDAVATGLQPVWSPDGKRIAFREYSSSGIAVIDADGSNLHEITVLAALDPAWSPDGSHVLFGATTTETSLPSSRFGYPTRQDIWTVPADGTGAAHRLSGPYAELNLGGPVATRPSLSPDGSELLYHVPGGVIAANADGTCARPLTAIVNAEEGPYWRPGSSGTAARCVSLVVQATVDATTLALNQEATVTLTIENHGNQTAHGVLVRVTPSTQTTTLAGCEGSGTCAARDIPPGGTQTVSASFSGFRAGTAGVRYEVDDLDNEDEVTGVVGGTVLNCTRVGTWGPDRLVGTNGNDKICGLPGDDYISGARGNDYLDAGPGNDTVYGGAGRDTILGRGGRDTIFARDGQRDWIDCGAQYDVAVVDKHDVTRHCERILRK